MKKYEFFWSGPFSNWDYSAFTLDGKNFTCEEQHMMYHKAMTFGDTESAEKIMQTSSPREQKALGRQVKNFNPDIWASVCQPIVYEGLKAKFLQNKEHFDYLCSTGDAEIVEASPEDRIWGIGFTANTALD